MRARHVNERRRILGNIVQEQPGLDRGMERIGMQPQLRIGCAVEALRQDGLDVVERALAAAADTSISCVAAGVRHARRTFVPK